VKNGDPTLNELLDYFIKSGLKIFNQKVDKDSLIIEFDVYAKPGSKKESVVISESGVLIIKTHSRPIDGLANMAIVEMVAKNLGVSKSSVDLVRGEKSKNKRIKILFSATENKKEKYYLDKATLILVEQA
jgi:uncharacterized protein (TIGR00251 family)